MSTEYVILESTRPLQSAFRSYSIMAGSLADADSFKSSHFGELQALGVRLRPSVPPVPLFGEEGVVDEIRVFSVRGVEEGASRPDHADFRADSVAVAAEVDSDLIPKLESLGYMVWPDVPMRLLAPRVDCRPFAPPVDLDRVRRELGVEDAFEAGFNGSGCVVAIVDEGVNSFYRVVGGATSPYFPKPGSAPISSHGSMCAADVLVAAPEAQLLDYPLLNPRTSNQLALLQEILTERQRTGRPHIANNSYGFYSLSADPRHPGRDPRHPFNRKVRELVGAGITCFFAAGNCGPDCPAANCDFSAIGPNKSINGANSLLEVLTIAAVNADRVRIGYSSVGPGLIETRKPDLAAYSHFYGNFGPGRPGGGGPQNYDNGTSAASPVAAGVAALLWSRDHTLDPARMRQVILNGLIDTPAGGFDHNIGHGVIHAGRSFALL